jgi:hypothetical protein
MDQINRLVTDILSTTDHVQHQILIEGETENAPSSTEKCAFLSFKFRNKYGQEGVIVLIS